jgi:hypothetical protein
MFSIARRIEVIAGRYSVFAPYRAVPALGLEFASAGFLDAAKPSGCCANCRYRLLHLCQPPKLLLQGNL